MDWKYKVDDEWEWYIGELYHKLLSSLISFKVDTAIELAPGYRYKVAYALKKMNFKGTLYIIDSNKDVCKYVYNKYSELLKDANIICIKTAINNTIASGERIKKSIRPANKPGHKARIVSLFPDDKPWSNLLTAIQHKNTISVSFIIVAHQ